jgi:16S rRNA (cytosine1402-N4)-methyltransferase
MKHQSVMVHEVLKWFDLPNRNLIIDATLGLGGHSEAFLNSPEFKGSVMGIDRDEKHLKFARERLVGFRDRFRGVHCRFSEFRAHVCRFDGILLDLGVASPHLDDFERGFSYRDDGELDMRMDESGGKTARDVLMTYKEEELADVFYCYGEERLGRKIARWIVEDRENGIEFNSTGELADLVCRAYRTKYKGGSHSHPATKVFQALRIEVNSEIRELEDVLRRIADSIDIGGRVVVISYHSLEDRIVKRFFRDSERLEALTKRPLTASDAEIFLNPRARSAKMRVACCLNSD